MRFDGIRLFVLSTKYLNITKAAGEIHISQSAASRQIKELERVLGIKLFKENGRGRVLTQAGQTFLDRISPLWLQLEELEKMYSPGGGDSIVVAASYRPSKYFLPAVMTEFSNKHPTSKLTLVTRSSIAIDKLLLDSRVDLAITTNPTVPTSSFVTERYFTEPLTAFVAANHPLAKAKSVRAAEVGAIPVIIKLARERRSRLEVQLSKLEKEGVKFKIVMRCESPDVVKEFVRQGAGVGFLYYNSIKRGIARGEFKAIQFPGLDLAGQNYIVYSKEKPLCSLAREFLSFLRASMVIDCASVTATRPTLPAHRNGRAQDQVVRSRPLY